MNRVRIIRRRIDVGQESGDGLGSSCGTPRSHRKIPIVMLRTPGVEWRWAGRARMLVLCSPAEVSPNREAMSACAAQHRFGLPGRPGPDRRLVLGAGGVTLRAGVPIVAARKPYGKDVARTVVVRTTRLDPDIDSSDRRAVDDACRSGVGGMHSFGHGTGIGNCERQRPRVAGWRGDDQQYRTQPRESEAHASAVPWGWSRGIPDNCLPVGRKGFSFRPAGCYVGTVVCLSHPTWIYVYRRHHSPRLPSHLCHRCLRGYGRAAPRAGRARLPGPQRHPQHCCHRSGRYGRQ